MSDTIDKNKDIKQELSSLGMDENEATVYLSLLKLGEVGASKIVRDTGLHGQTVYDALHKLETKNLVRFNLIKGRRKFISQNPSILLNLVNKQQQIVESVLNKIEKRFSIIDTDNIEIIKGKDSFVINEFKMLQEVPKGSELLILGGSGDSFIANFGNKFNEYDYQRTKKGISVKYLGSETQKKYLTDSVDSRHNFEYRVIPQVFSGVTNITIFKNHAIVIYLFDENTTSIVIRNKKIVESYEGFFESLWGLGK